MLREYEFVYEENTEIGEQITYGVVIDNGASQKGAHRLDLGIDLRMIVSRHKIIPGIEHEHSIDTPL